MFRIRSISLVHFKNYWEKSFEFPDRITGISGKNGSGKTNLLDAIHYLCFTKSYFHRSDFNTVLQGNKGFRVEGDFVLPGKQERAVCIFRETGKKEFSVNDKAYEKFSKHIGRYPCVTVFPDDTQLLTGGSEERRRFLDALLSQLNSGYLEQLVAYNKVILQRNSLLRSFSETGSMNLSLLEVLDNQLIGPGEFLFSSRKEFLVSFLPVVEKFYRDISQSPEGVSVVYESELLHSAFEELLKASRQKDLALCRTSAGIHRDDLCMQMGQQPFKFIASQGQRKSFLFALKLAEMEVLRNAKGFAPLLLLDDVFEKLDEDRIGRLLQKVCRENKGQVFITDTDKERLCRHMEEMDLSFQLIEL